MTKTYYRTCDIFNNENAEKRKAYFVYCHKKALNSGLACKSINVETEPRLYIRGTKWQLIKYYFITLLKCDCKVGGIKRLMNVIFD